MNPIYSEDVSGPLADDIVGVQAIHGAPAPDTRQPGFDAGYYLTVNADVRASLGAGNSQGAFEHYLRYGARGQGARPGVRGELVSRLQPGRGPRGGARQLPVRLPALCRKRPEGGAQPRLAVRRGLLPRHLHRCGRSGGGGLAAVGRPAFRRLWYGRGSGSRPGLRRRLLPEHLSGRGGGTLGDPYPRIYSSGGMLLASNDDSGGTLDSSLLHRATATATVYAEAAAYSTGTGTYTLSVARSSSIAALAEA